MTHDQLDIQDILTSAMLVISKPFFMELILLIAWSIWTTRNGFIFKAVPPSIYMCRKKFKDEIALLVHKAKRK
jgi:hypothetical protein